MTGDRPPGSKPDSRTLDTGKLAVRILDPISFCRTAVLIWLFGLLVLLSACSAEARSAGFKPSRPPYRVAIEVPEAHADAHPATDICNARAERLVDRPKLPDAEVGNLHLRRVVVDISPESGSPNENGEKPATWASLHRPAVTAGRCIFLSLSTVHGGDSIA